MQIIGRPGHIEKLAHIAAAAEARNVKGSEDEGKFTFSSLFSSSLAHFLSAAYYLLRISLKLKQTTVRTSSALSG